MMRLAVAMALATSCRHDRCPSAAASASTYAAVSESDGRMALYYGPGMEARIARHEDLESATNLNAFLRVRIPPSLADEVRALPATPTPRQEFLSMEAARPGVEITFHDADPASQMEDSNYCVSPTRAKNQTFVPGQPWVSGYLRVAAREDGSLFAGARVIMYSGTWPLARQELWRGTSECTNDNCPALKYESNLVCAWPPVPETWTLVTNTGQPTSLDAACSKDDQPSTDGGVQHPG